MTTKTRWAIGGALVALAGVAIAYRAMSHRAPPPAHVQIEPVARHEVVATVTATGQLEPHTKVDVIADVTGRIMRVGVHEGDRVKAGQFLVQIDPAQTQAEVERDTAGVATAQSALVQARTNLALAERQYQRTAELQHDNSALVAADEIDRLRTTVVLDSALLQSAAHAVEQARATLAESRSALAKTTLVAPMDGEVTRLAVAVGDMAIPGTYSRDAATLLTISDMSALETKVNVPEGDVARLDVGDSAVITIDALPDSTFPGRVVAIAHSSVHDPTGGSTASGTSASSGSAHVVDYEVTVRLLRVPHRIHPDFSATAKLIAAVRHEAIAVPIIALAVRQRPPVTPPPGDTRAAKRVVAVIPAPAGDEAPHDEEGVYVVGAHDSVHFRPVTIGVTGDRYAEVLAGLTPGERIVGGPYDVLRNLKDGARVSAQ